MRLCERCGRLGIGAAHIHRVRVAGNALDERGAADAPAKAETSDSDSHAADPLSTTHFSEPAHRKDRLPFGVAQGDSPMNHMMNVRAAIMLSALAAAAPALLPPLLD